MKYEDFTEKMRQDIIDATKTSLLKLGIDVDVMLKAETIRSNRDCILYVETSKFNTTPVIYKSIFIFGFGYIAEVEGHSDIFDLFIPLSYRFGYFGGGYNGVYIGTLHFRIFDKTMRVENMGLKI